MRWRSKMGEPMRTPFMVRGILTILAVAVGLLVEGEIGRVPRASAAEPVPDKDYVVIFERGSDARPFAVLEKPKSAQTGAGTSIEIEAFGLRVSPIDAPHAGALLRRLPELDSAKSRELPPGFRVYADSRYVVPSYAAGSHRYKIVFTDPADAMGMGKGGDAGGTGGGSGGSGGGSM
jgi:hypothetical protein